MIKITHENYGFFSCCSVRLFHIVDHVNKHNRLPNGVDTSNSFCLYKKNKHDVVFDFFKHYNSVLNTGNGILFKWNPSKYEKIPDINTWMYQQTNYKNVPYTKIIPYIKKYFEPSPMINRATQFIMQKYRIYPENCIAVYYRGTDKYTETQIDSYDSFYRKILEISRGKNMQIFIQTDTKQFLDYIQSKRLKNVVVVNETRISTSTEGIHNENNPVNNYRDITYLLPAVKIMAQCKYVICTSGNVSIWIMFYRGSAYNVHQNLNCKWI